MYSAIINDIFNKLLTNISENDNKMSDHTIRDLYDLFGTTFINCIPMIDNKCVTQLCSSSGKVIHRVESMVTNGSPKRYICLIHCNYCNCSSFNINALNGESFICEHLLAAKLCETLNKCDVINISDEQMRSLLKHM